MKKISLVLALALVALLFASCKKENKLEQQIIGKWITTDVDGHAELTNNKSVITFLSPTQAVISTSRANLSENQGWASHLNASVVMDGNKVTITGQPNEHGIGKPRCFQKRRGFYSRALPLQSSKKIHLAYLT